MATYKEAGVNKEAGYETVKKIKQSVKNTFNDNVLNDLGGFGALYQLKNYEEPVLVSGTDGVGTKLMLSEKYHKWDTVGQDCFAMCANDILCHGAKPIFFLDYLACGKLDPTIAADIIIGLAKVCQENDTALVGGESAEMPGMYKVGDYDIAGFCVGVVEKKKLIDCSQIAEGDVVVGISSSGLHSNGFSLVRKLFTTFDKKVKGQHLYEILLQPTTVYVNPVLNVLSLFQVKGMAHITGGGMIENIPRIIPDGLCAKIVSKNIPKQDIFDLIKAEGVSSDEMWGTFNMGVGFILVVSAQQADAVCSTLSGMGAQAFVLGNITQHSTQKIMIE